MITNVKNVIISFILKEKILEWKYFLFSFNPDMIKTTNI